MEQSSDIVKLLLSGVMGIVGGLVTIPINAILSWSLERDKIQLQHRLDMIAKKQELLLQHNLDLEKLKKYDSEIDEIRNSLLKLQKRVNNEQ